ncbi:M23 family peptidase [Blastococcus sp. TF02-8]|uniref:M23 family metallopeptidase n=1 Tax=Blastococcus sp. TF02-8 TaxID=2250574 RepID=UPI000DE8290A|nr:M23 family metallopeptidase [Blastococcus sp. TF02-8]RBY93461.1 M23 family peptidase [Blastococcus sp. TF02-8]
MSRSSAQVLERPATDDVPKQSSAVIRALAARRSAVHDSRDEKVTATAEPSLLGRLLAGRRLPHPPGRRAPLWFAALVAGAVVAGVPATFGDAPAVSATASDYGLGESTEVSFAGGLEGADARRGISEAEAQARLDELAASRAARQPKTVLPVHGTLTTCFCMRWGSMHYGLDLAAPLGTPIVAATDGVVVKAGRASGYGNAVYIQDADGNVHIYGHMRYYNVKAGDIVTAGDQIAKVGNEGQSTGPHLHYEIHRGGMDGRPTDPAKYLAEHGVGL